MQLNQLRDKPGATKERTRVGRGPGSGKGKTAGRGHKGQKSRTGVSIRGFEGGQMPIYRRLPKRGFNVLNPKELAVVNIGRLQKLIDSGRLDASKPVDGAALEAAGMVRQRRDGIRLLASGELKAKLAITVDHASASAISAVEKAGGTVTIVAPKVSPEDADANKLKAEKRADKKAGKKSSKSGKGNE
jgi:large subunit ribosomal protein L15